MMMNSKSVIMTIPLFLLLLLYYVETGYCFKSPQKTKLSQMFSSSSSSSSQKRTVSPFNQFEVVTNDNGAIVGQLVGDGVVISGLSTTTIEICLEIDNSIETDNVTYNTTDLATFNKTGSELFRPLGAANATIVSGQICANINMSGVYFPIFRLFDFNGPTVNSTLSDALTTDGSGGGKLSTLGIILVVIVIGVAFITLAIIVGLVFTGNLTNGYNYEEETEVETQEDETEPKRRRGGRRRKY